MQRSFSLCLLLAFSFFTFETFAFGSPSPAPDPEPTPSPNPPPRPEPEPEPGPEEPPEESEVEVTGVYIIDVRSGKRLRALGDGLTIRFPESETELLDVQVEFKEEFSGSVFSKWDSRHALTDSSSPFRVFNNAYLARDYITDGSHNLVMKFYSLPNARGTLLLTKELRFRLDRREPPAPAPEPTPPPRPTPEPDPSPTPDPGPDPGEPDEPDEPEEPSYDPRKDPAYKDYKYKPGQGFSIRSGVNLKPRPKCIKEVKDTIRVKGSFDGKGCLYTFKGKWKGKSYKKICFAPEEISEGMPPMFKLEPGASLKNVQIECALDGIHTTRNNTIDNVIMRDVEEDAITAKENITIKNSEFWFCNDKCIQMNRANNVKIHNNKFYYSTSAILANYGRNVEVKNNYFWETRNGIRSRTDKSTVFTQNNDHDGGKYHLMAQDKGYLEDRGVGQIRNVRYIRREENGGRISQK